MTKLFEFKSMSLFEINLIINMLDMEVRQPWSVGFQKKTILSDYSQETTDIIIIYLVQLTTRLKKA